MKKNSHLASIELSHGFLEFALNHVSEAIFLLGPDAHFYFVNDQACRSLGYERDELLALSLEDIDPDFDLTSGNWAKHWQEIKRLRTLKFESRHKTKQGVLIPVEITTNFFEFDGHEFNLALVHSISERIIARNIADLHSEILLNVHEGVQMTRVDDETIVYATPVFNRMFGYDNDELIGKKVSTLNAQNKNSAKRTAREINLKLKESGHWRGEIHNIRKDGSSFICWVNISTFDHHAFGKVWVAVHEDITQRKLAELQMQQDRANAHRDLLVREVHHRIKNNLQGIVNILRQLAQKHHKTAGPIKQAMGQIQSIAVIHGLQGRTSLATVRLCELTRAIVSGVESTWQKPVNVDIPDTWTPCIIAELEAVPMALVLNELISNAVKHGGQDGSTKVKLRHEPNPLAIRLSIQNTGQLPADFEQNKFKNTGLELVFSLLPSHGVRLTWQQQGSIVVTTLEIDTPVIELET